MYIRRMEGRGKCGDGLGSTTAGLKLEGGVAGAVGLGGDDAQSWGFVGSVMGSLTINSKKIVPR